MARMSIPIRSWGFVIPRLHWARRTHDPLASLPLEEVARALPRWGQAEVRAGHAPEPAWPRPFTRDEMLLMERMGRIR